MLIAAGAHKVGLQRGTEPVRQAACSDINDTAEKGVGLRCFFGTDLHAPTNW